MKKFLDIKNLTIAFSKIENKDQNILMKFLVDKKRSYTLLRDVNLSVFEGEYLGLVGESGCGKSLTMKSVFGMIDFDPGIVNGKIDIYDSETNDNINILDTKKRKNIKSSLMNTYYSTVHLCINDNKIIIPENFKIDNNISLILYNKLGDHCILELGKKDFSYSISLSNKYKKYTYAFLLGKTYIPIDNKNNIKDILKSSSKHNIPGKYISIILQDPLSFMNPYWSMLRQMNNLKDMHSNDNVNDINSILSFVKLNTDNFKRALPRELSGGQGQRAMIVLSSLTKPKLLIADEPTTGLDVTLKKIIVEKFKGLKKQISDKFSMIFISHDLNMVRRATNRMNVMYKGQIIENGFSKDFINEEGHHPYTSKLINITHSNFENSYNDEKSIIDDNDFGGCSYYDSCNHAKKNKLCMEVSPPPISIKNGKILVNEDPTISWVKCWPFIKEES